MRQQRLLPAYHFNQLHLNRTRNCSELTNLHLPKLVWKQLNFLHQLKLRVNPAFQIGNHSYMFHEASSNLREVGADCVKWSPRLYPIASPPSLAEQSRKVVSRIVGVPSSWIVDEQ
jgi:hypothetical protein